MEINILMAIQQWHTPFLDLFFSNITALGDKGLFWILAGLLLLYMKRYRKQGFLLLLSLLICFLVGNVFLKNFVARDRPCWLYPEIELLIKYPRDFSFPSGHTMTGMAGAVCVYLTDKRLGIPAIILAVIIAFSRLYLFVHWPSDVLIGGLIGITVACTVFTLAGRLKWTSGKTEGIQ